MQNSRVQTFLEVTLKKADFTDTSFMSAKLRSPATFAGATFSFNSSSVCSKEQQFKDASIVNVCLDHAQFKNVDLGKAINFNQNSLNGTDFTGTSFAGRCNLISLDFSGTKNLSPNFNGTLGTKGEKRKIHWVDFHGMDLHNFDFSNCEFYVDPTSRYYQGTFKGANLSGASFKNTKFTAGIGSNISFNGAHLNGVDFSTCSYTDGTTMDFRNAFLDNATLNFLNIPDKSNIRLNFTNAKLYYAIIRINLNKFINPPNFDGAALTFASFGETEHNPIPSIFDKSISKIFAKTNFIFTNLSGMDLSNSTCGDLPAIDFTGANFTGVNLTGQTIPAPSGLIPSEYNNNYKGSLCFINLIYADVTRANFNKFGASNVIIKDGNMVQYRLDRWENL